MSILHNTAEFDDLLYHYKGPTKDIDFSGYIDAKDLFNMIKNKDISLSNAEENQADLKSELSSINIGDKKRTAQKKVTKNVEKFYDSREAIINFYKGYSSMAINAAYDAKQQKPSGLKTLTPKQIPQRLQIALAQIKAGNNSETLLNGIRQIVYSLYQSKKLPKKYVIT